ncbi:hypothetical protein XELAEV_18025551mg [Xenopus laevis]|uniref:Uncharacterized protein n=1 Tax=Xenopus laevis TaxID=8355 RepID=A0A974HM72_XENLA|nr:hypothetical protein XELAEV_18025551mg [Xenopus laevis]
MVWTCPKLTHYWVEIFAFISKVMVLPIQPNPTLALLGHTGGLVNSVESRILLQLLMYYAKKLIVLKWNRSAAPTLKELKDLVNKALLYYKPVYMSIGCTDKFIAIWMIWVLNSNTNIPNVF